MERSGFPEDRYWNRVTQTASREALDHRHLERIRALVGWAYDHSPLHRRIYDKAGVKPADIRTWEDFHHRLPFTDKPDYLADQDEAGIGGLALPREHWQQYFHTTGTTGRFLHEVFTQFEMHKGGSQICYGLWDHGVRPGDSAYLSFDFGMWIGLWTFYWAARNLGLQVVSGGGARGVERVRQILDRRPTIVAGTPTYLLHLAELARAEGLDLRDAGVRMLTGGGEPGFSVPATRDQLIDAWGAEQVFDCYGVGEALFAGSSCREWAGGVHVIEDAFHSYTVDPGSGEPIQEDNAVGEQILTSYVHFSQPFVKYRTHDLVRYDAHPDHGCGWTWAHLPGVVLGRTDFMVVIRGVNIYPTAVENLVGTVDGLTNHYELHVSRVDGMDRMLVRVEAVDPAADVASLAARLGETLRTNLGVRLETEVLIPGSLPRYELKTKRFFDHRAADERPQATLVGGVALRRPADN
ncbi:MAG: phenylacetate--CoA ligase family protein [Actinomycetota bacterium]